MTFTPETPTQSGDFAWKLDHDCPGYMVRQVGVCGFEGVSYLGELEHGKPISSLGGLWCRLVAADEVEKLKVDTTIIHPGDPDMPPDEILRAAQLVGDYFASRTSGYWACGPVCSRFKRVVEGGE